MIGYDASINDHTLIKDQNGNITTQGTISCVGNLTAANIYTKTEVDSLLSNTQQTLLFKDPTQLSPPVKGFPLLHASNIVPGLVVVSPLTLTYHGNDYIEIGLAVDLRQKANTATTYTTTEVDNMIATKASTSYVDSSVSSVLSQNSLRLAR